MIARVTAILFAFHLISLVADAGDLKSPIASLDLKNGDCIVFLGDSITHQRLHTQYVEDYFYTRFPQMRLKLHNAGVSGSMAWEALERFDRDVATYKPKYVTVPRGMNDGEHQPFDQMIFDNYRRDMMSIVRRIREMGATPVLMTPTMFDARVRRAQRPDADAESTAMYNSVLAYYGAWLREVATEQGLGFVDLWGPLNGIAIEKRKTDPNFTLIPDSVHPGPAAQVVMAAAFVRDLGLSRQLSSISVILNSNDDQQVHATGGKLTELLWGNDRLEFVWHAEGLPWVLPQDAQAGAKLSELGHLLSSESLEVHGLRPGKYTLAIDGKEVGTYSHIQLERGIELQENANTPQYQQALSVAHLNRQRNEGPINALRDEWWDYQDFIDARREVVEHPDSVELKNKLAKSERKILGMNARVARHEADALAIEDKIFDINQPPPRKYVLVLAAVRK